MNFHILEECRRCLQCRKPSCTEGCPVGTEIPKMIRLLLDGNINESGEMLFRNNPLSAICALVCQHEKVCEGHCILAKKQSPIQIGNIEHYISDYYLNVLDPQREEAHNHRIAIIGSGPAGLSLAFFLVLKGYGVTIFEANEDIGGVLRYGIPSFRLPKDILDRMRARLREMGVKIRPNVLIGSIVTVDELFRDGFDAVFIGTGVWNPNKLNIKGECLGNVTYAIDFLRSPDAFDLGSSVIVIGAGNSAMDTARTALRQGARSVRILYHRGPEDIPARDQEVQYARIDGVKFEFYRKALEITEKGIDCEILRRPEGAEKDPDGEPGGHVFIDADTIIVCISQGPRSNIVSNTTGIDINDRGLVVVDDCGRTTREGVFASGDVVTGPRTVVEAVAFSKRVEQAIDCYIRERCTAGCPPGPRRRKNPSK